MSVIEWSDALEVGIQFIDDDHREAVELINAMAKESGTRRVALLDAFIAHSEAHFGREEELMREVGFFAFGPHKGEHTRVLEELAEVRARLETGDDGGLDGYFSETLPQWLIGHRDTMDMATAVFARQAGYKD